MASDKQPDTHLTGDRDIGPNNGVRPPTATPIDEQLHDVANGSGYSGQEYDAEGQAEWRAEQDRRALPQDGAVHGSGKGAGGGDEGEDFDETRTGGTATE